MDITCHFNITNASSKTNWDILSILFRHQLKQVDSEQSKLVFTGFCMRGDQCKFDHGNDAVILADSVPAYNPAAPSTAPSLDTTVPPPPSIHGIPPPGIVDPYVPGPIIIDPNGPPPPSGEPMPPLHLPPPGFTTSMSVPPPTSQIPMAGQKRSYEGGYVEQGNYGPAAKRGFDYNRLGRGGRGRGRNFLGRGGSSTQVSKTVNTISRLFHTKKIDIYIINNNVS